MSTRELPRETCTRGLFGFSKLGRDDMRLLGSPDDQPEIDLCQGVERVHNYWPVRNELDP
jgi:hypothetical protein